MNAQRYWINADGGLVVQPERFYADDDVIMATDYATVAARIAELEAALQLIANSFTVGKGYSHTLGDMTAIARAALASPAKGPPMNLHNLPRDES